MKRGKNQDCSISVGSYALRRVVSIDDAFETILRVHNDCGHNGYNKTWEVFEEQYYGIIRQDVSINSFKFYSIYNVLNNY